MKEMNVLVKPRAEGKLAFIMPRRENACCEATTVLVKPRAEGKLAFIMPRRENRPTGGHEHRLIKNNSANNVRMYSKFLCLLATLLLFWGCAKDECDPPTPKTSILLDSDMVEAFDDGVTFMMLLGSENVEVKGLTTVTGNSWAQEGLTYGIRLGELCGGDNLTYIAGASRPMREGRLDDADLRKDAHSLVGDD